nr:NADH dehydrogenase subunit 2 [Tomostethus sp. 1 QHW-2022a]
MKKYFFKKNLFKMNLSWYMFLYNLIFSTIIIMNSYSWFNIWMGLEINLMSFIPLMMNNSKMMKISNSMMIYFLIQVSASSMLLMMIIMMKINTNIIENNMLMSLIQLSIMMKLGAAPFHWWMPKMISNLTWLNCFIILTWQKIAPLYILLMTNNNLIIYLISMMSCLIGAIMGLNQTSIKLILTYSSINHIGWMLMLMMLSMKMLIMYFLIYMLLNFMICLMMNNNSFNYLNQLMKNNNQNMNMKIISISLFLSLGGMPPMLGFLPKMITLMIMIKNNLFFELMIFILSAVISLSFYMNPMMSMFMFLKLNNKWNNKIMMLKNNLMKIMLFNLSLMMIIILPNLNELMM